MEEDLKDLIFGRNPVREALAASLPLEKIYFQKSIPDPLIIELRKQAQARKIPYVFVDKPRLDWLSHQGLHQGVVAKKQTWEYSSPEELLAKARTCDEPPFFLACFQLQDPHNLGSLIRTAECAGVHGIIIPRNKSVGVTAAVSKVASGADSYVPIARVSNLWDTLMFMKEEGLKIVGAQHGAGVNYRTAEYSGPLVVLLGGEERGLDRRLRTICDQMVHIPQRGKINSLNVGVAGALVLFEVVDQRIRTYLPKNNQNT
jgi:23S rRNA (guanosine2251-2'-O)-methyltransferase